MNKRPAGLIKKLKQFELGDVGISTITVSELQYGVAKSIHRKESQQPLEQFLENTAA